MKTGKKRILWTVAFFVILCVGGILGNRKALAAGSPDYAKVKKAIITAYENYKTSVNVKDCNVYNNAKDNSKINKILEEVINETPYLFYTGHEYSKEIITSTNQITKINITYVSDYMTKGTVNAAKIKSTRKKIDGKVKEAAKLVNNTMTTVEKAMVLHDYLVDHIAYCNTASVDSRLSEVGALLKGKANCQGYSVAYMALLNKVGISAKCVSSASMSHMWNLVKIGSSWYHVDVTWDDPVSIYNKKDQYGIVCHNNFLLSNKGIKKEGHFGFQASGATNTKYDKKYWRNVQTGFWYRSKKFVYATSKGIYTRTHLTKAKAKTKKKLANTACLTKYKGQKYYVIANNRIYRYNLKSNALKRVYTPPAGTYLTQAKYKNKKIYFRYLKNRKLYTKSKKAT